MLRGQIGRAPALGTGAHRERAAARGLPGIPRLTLEEVRVPLLTEVPTRVADNEELPARAELVNEVKGQRLVVENERRCRWRSQPTISAQTTSCDSEPVMPDAR